MYTRLFESDQISHTQSMVAQRGLTNRANVYALRFSTFGCNSTLFHSTNKIENGDPRLSGDARRHSYYSNFRTSVGPSCPQVHCIWPIMSASSFRLECLIYYWNKVTVHHLKLCYFLMKKDNTMICGVLLNHCLTVNRIISKSVCLDTRLRDTSLKRCGVKSQFTNSVSCVSIIGVDASLTTTTWFNRTPQIIVLSFFIKK